MVSFREHEMQNPGVKSHLHHESLQVACLWTRVPLSGSHRYMHMPPACLSSQDFSTEGIISDNPVLLNSGSVTCKGGDSGYSDVPAWSHTALWIKGSWSHVYRKKGTGSVWGLLLSKFSDSQWASYKAQPVDRGATVPVTGQLWELDAPWKLLALICISKPAQQMPLGGGPRPYLLLPAREEAAPWRRSRDSISDPASPSPLLQLPSSSPQPPTKSFLPHIQNSKTLPLVPSGSELWSTAHWLLGILQGLNIPTSGLMLPLQSPALDLTETVQLPQEAWGPRIVISQSHTSASVLESPELHSAIQDHTPLSLPLPVWDYLATPTSLTHRTSSQCTRLGTFCLCFRPTHNS